MVIIIKIRWSLCFLSSPYQPLFLYFVFSPLSGFSTLLIVHYIHINWQYFYFSLKLQLSYFFLFVTQNWFRFIESLIHIRKIRKFSFCSLKGSSWVYWNNRVNLLVNNISGSQATNLLVIFLSGTLNLHHPISFSCPVFYPWVSTYLEWLPSLSTLWMLNESLGSLINVNQSIRTFLAFIICIASVRSLERCS